MKEQERILVTPRSLTAAGLERVLELEPLRRAGFELVASPAGRLPSSAEMSELVCAGRVVGWLAGVEQISAQVLQKAGALRVIARNGVGTDNIDTVAAADLGIEVRNASGVNAQSVAELAVALGLSMLRGIPRSSRALRDGRWERRKGHELGETRVGVIGYGQIGRRVARMFTALGAPVLAHDPFIGGVADHELVADLTDLLSGSDLVTLHLPPSPSGPLLDAGRLMLLPRGAIVVNTARSALVDAGAMYAALKSGRVSGYAVDVFDQEPPILDDLLSHPGTVMSPHVGGYTDASIRRATRAAVTNLLDVLVGRAREAIPADRDT